MFGSRVDDATRGGDFDVLVQTDEGNAAGLIDAKLAFLVTLDDTPAFESERTAVVLRSTALDPQPRPIHDEALQEGIELK